MDNRGKVEASRSRDAHDTPDNGSQPVKIKFGNYSSCLEAGFYLFAFLAYPEKEKWTKRERFIFEMKAEMYQTYKELGGDAHNVPRGFLQRFDWRTGEPAIGKRREDYLKRRRRLIRGGFGLGFKRVFQRRIIAGGVALAAWQRADTQEHAAVIIQENLYNSWLQKEDNRYIGDLEQRAVRFRDFKGAVWAETVPVLHLAAALHIAFLQYRPEIPRTEKLPFMLKDPRWIQRTLVYADSKLLLEFGKWIPGFRVARAIRLIPE
jgi:hypothetical protein